jgi:hypothetical protein
VCVYINPHWCVCILLQDLVQSCLHGGGGIWETRRKCFAAPVLTFGTDVNLTLTFTYVPFSGRLKISEEICLRIWAKGRVFRFRR